MRKSVLLLAVMCLLLAGCAEQSDKFAHGEAGNYYNEFISDGSQPDSYIVTAEAHVDDVLSLLYINTAAETGLGFELKLESCDGDICYTALARMAPNILWRELLTRQV